MLIFGHQSQRSLLGTPFPREDLYLSGIQTLSRSGTDLVDPFKNPRLNLGVPISAPPSLQVDPFGVASKCIYPQVYITFGFQLLVTVFSSFEYFPIICKLRNVFKNASYNLSRIEFFSKKAFPSI